MKAFVCLPVDTAKDSEGVDVRIEGIEEIIAETGFLGFEVR